MKKSAFAVVSVLVLGILGWLFVRDEVSPPPASDMNGIRGGGVGQASASQESFARESARGAAHVRLAVRSRYAEPVLGAFVACYVDVDGVLSQVWRQDLSSGNFEKLVGVPPQTKVVFGFRVPNQQLSEFGETLVVPSGETRECSFDLDKYGSVIFDVSGIPPHLRRDSIVMSIYGVSGCSASFPALATEQGVLRVLARPEMSVASVELQGVALVGRGGRQAVFPLTDGRRYTLELPPEAFVITAYKGVNRIGEFAVTGAGEPIIASGGQAVVTRAQIKEDNLVAISKSGFGRLDAASLLPLVENRVSVTSDWCELEVLVQNAPSGEWSLQLSGPSPDGDPIAPLPYDVRVRSEPVRDGICRFFPVTPGVHHLRLVSKDGNPSAVVATARVYDAPRLQRVQVTLDGLCWSRCHINGMGEVMDFLGINYLSRGRSSSLGRLGDTSAWTSTDRVTVIPLNSSAFPGGLPVDLFRQGEVFEGGLAPDIAFVSIDARARHGGVVSVRRPGSMVALKEYQQVLRCVATQGQSLPLLAWEYTRKGEYLIGAVKQVPRARYCSISIETSGRWLAATVVGADGLVDVDVIVGGVRVTLGRYPSGYPVNMWIPSIVKSMIFSSGERSKRIDVVASINALEVSL